MIAVETQGIRTEFWPVDAEQGTAAVVEIERAEDEPRVAMFTMVDGEGSKTSYYFDREATIALAHALLGAVVLR